MKKETIEKSKKDAEKDFNYLINETGEYRDTWRIFRIMAEFIEGYQFLSSLDKEVTILGSARLAEDHKYAKKATDLGFLLAKKGYTTITGGGPGIMQAANKGAFEAGGQSIGLNIQLPFEQRINPYVTKSTAFYYFFTRKVMLTSPAHALVFFPGGFGTMDEFFEVVDHIELGKMCGVPVILFGSDFWKPLVEFLKKDCCKVGSIHVEKVSEWLIVDSEEEVLEVIENFDRSNYDKCELAPMNFHKNTKDIDWRIFRIMAELVEGFELLTGLVEGVTVLGTKSMEDGNPYYDAAYTLGRELGNHGYAVVTGGASGIAEAANKGAMEVGAESYGIGMEVFGKSRMNQYVTKSISFRYPFTRKLIVTAPSKAFVFFPGGLGTMHQFFEVLTLIQTGKMQQIPIILFDSSFWGDLDNYISETLAKNFKTISKKDCEYYTIVDDIGVAMDIIKKFRGKED
ncbi:MAG: TIGR00730 family Rossman fold protein [Candidatus Magasanikbacteria bacterium]